jgi:hypothetical protein
MVDVIETGMAQTSIAFVVGNRPHQIVGALAAAFDPLFDGVVAIPGTKAAEAARNVLIVAVPVEIWRVFGL